MGPPGGRPGPQEHASDALSRPARGSSVRPRRDLSPEGTAGPHVEQEWPQRLGRSAALTPHNPAEQTGPSAGAATRVEGSPPEPTRSSVARPPAEELRLSDWFHPGKRPDVVAITDWLAPVIWEGTFNRRVLGRYYGRQNLTIGLAVLATGRTADRYLELFMRSANKHFMSGYRVVFYIMVDDPLRTFKVLPIKGDRWGDFHLTRMSSLAEHILGHIEDEVDFLFSMTVNRVFQNDFGVETLGASVAQLHAWWYFKNKDIPYERRPKSAACIPFGQGDFYYDGSVIGGRPLEVLTLIEGYLQGVAQDHKDGLNSTYERHLNKYFFTHKPTKLLSPEYSWTAALRPPAQVWSVKATRLSRRYF
ncbi:putative glycosyltransferase 6 domain-containing protein 1 [Lynx canadensis]|uniref:putative glycosyltransferase 6 domain-containing protein 1 n=1 Tax=Lynx canadensis TaxID=61383 RepID=UPI00165A0EAC|nr:putative glycosyltransferase 6 domain-containing protein 1 [Lynx canadensis]